jgi:hypothetical protein
MASDQEKELAAPIKAQRLAYGPAGHRFGMSFAFLIVVKGKHCAED